MPVIKTYYCDNCNKIMRKKDRFLIYAIHYWNIKLQNTDRYDYDNYALMLCSEECIGKYIGNLIKGGNNNECNKNKTI